ncbi:MAG: hypothetical protein NVS1B7_5700 [Candidatus Saccharimonadales bacterium]
MTDKKIIDYQSANQELNQLLESLQNSELSIDEAVKAFERGIEISAMLEKYLKETDNKIIKIKSAYEKI